MRVIAIIPVALFLGCPVNPFHEYNPIDPQHDFDMDGFTESDGDCDDQNSLINPAAIELCDGIDGDCNGSADFNDGSEEDVDNDGFPICNDCDDNDDRIHPDQSEVCDGIDTDCNGLADADPLGEVDSDGDSQLSCLDCDDANTDVGDGFAELCDGLDNDCNGFPDADIAGEIDADADGALSCDDCDDSDPSRAPNLPELCNGIDDDCSGIADFGGFLEVDADSDGHFSCAECDDSNPNRFPGQIEACNGIDDDCNPATHAQPGTELDQDLDGYFQCEDCNDVNTLIHPGATEVCDSIDNNCDSFIDEGLSVDADGDGYYQTGACLSPSGDCDDNSPSIHPGATEVCDSIDNNCNGSTDEGLSTDGDGDGHYIPGSCVLPDDDCDDTNPAVFTGAVEACNGIDDNCDGNIDEGLSFDMDGDGFTNCTGDCDDGNGAVFPGQSESCNNIDDDCDGNIDEGYDNDLDGWTTCNGDCNDASIIIYPGNQELCDSIDNNCDLLVDNVPDIDGDGFTICTGDCDDLVASTYPGALELCNGVDDNCDGIVTAAETDGDGDSFFPCTGDCDDANASISPAATEVCDGIDNNCDGSVDEGLAVDGDGDGYFPLGSCASPSTDCDDNNSLVNPGAVEVCDSIDNNCNGSVDEGLSTDGDGDGHYVPGSCALPDDDCDDTNPAVFTGAVEACNGIDDNCDGNIDEGLSADLDGDGFTNCTGDCDDSNGAVFPGQFESCNNIDDNCDGNIDEGYDNDLDGWTTCNGDCNDTSTAIHPGHQEQCDGIDNDCDLLVDNSPDLDGDGFNICTGDCNDLDANMYPGAPEICNGNDDNCDGIVLAAESDGDGDGFYPCMGDCNDTDAMISPSATEICDSVDNNCDGNVDEGLSTDADGDGFYPVGSCSSPSTDCDDTDATTYPGAVEVCDFADNDCDGNIPVTELDSDLDGFAYCTGDCDDGNSAISPDAPEICNSIDDDCDGWADEGMDPDNDGDGYFGTPACLYHGADCDDSNPAVFPGATEFCDGIDNDCSGTVDDFLDFDTDLDGFNDLSSCSNPTDCDDLNPFINPAALEVCNGIDDNCDGALSPNEVDVDGDGWSICDGDCAPADPLIHPAAGEQCLDGIDNNCDGGIDTDTDFDGDGFSSCTGDCDDYRGVTFPGAPELCDGFDNDCNGNVDDAPLNQLCPSHISVASQVCAGFDGCQITSCAASNMFDADLEPANGCECGTDINFSCGNTSSITIFQQGDTNVFLGAGSIPSTPLGDGLPQWHKATNFLPTRPFTTDIRIYFSLNEDDAYRFEVFDLCGDPPVCASGLTEYSFGDFPNTTAHPVNGGGDLYIRVFRYRNIPGCQQYQLMLDFPFP